MRTAQPQTSLAQSPSSSGVRRKPIRRRSGQFGKCAAQQMKVGKEVPCRCRAFAEPSDIVEVGGGGDIVLRRDQFDLELADKLDGGRFSPKQLGPMCAEVNAEPSLSVLSALSWMTRVPTVEYKSRTTRRFPTSKVSAKWYQLMPLSFGSTTSALGQRHATNPFFVFGGWLNLSMRQGPFSWVLLSSLSSGCSVGALTKRSGP